MSAQEGTVVGLYVDLMSRVAVGHVIETATGRRYGVVEARTQMRGKHAGRQHLRCLVLGKEDVLAVGTEVHRIYWYKRKKGHA